jgi:hypothetical protein
MPGAPSPLPLSRLRESRALRRPGERSREAVPGRLSGRSQQLANGNRCECCRTTLHLSHGHGDHPRPLITVGDWPRESQCCFVALRSKRPVTRGIKDTKPFCETIKPCVMGASGSMLVHAGQEPIEPHGHPTTLEPKTTGILGPDVDRRFSTTFSKSGRPYGQRRGHEVPYGPRSRVSSRWLH